jgi:TolB-like protein/Flp pilus assembly protein TadD
MEAPIEIPNFELLREIGRGGMSRIYLARQLQPRRDVAIKIVSPGSSPDPAFLASLKVEGDTIASLSHDNVVTVHACGVVDQHYFLAMEILSGGDLSERIRKGMQPEAAIEVMVQIGNALFHAHQRQILHRDIKPENVMFHESGKAVLVDFGIAKEGDAQSSFTQAGAVVGTPHYMSPERCMGKVTDARSDLYAMGVMFFEMLTGKKIFEGRDTFAVSYAHVYEPVPPLPPEHARYQGFLNKLLAKNPDERFADAQSMVAALKPFREGSAAAVAPVTRRVDDGIAAELQARLSSALAVDAATRALPAALPAMPEPAPAAVSVSTRPPAATKAMRVALVAVPLLLFVAVAIWWKPAPTTPGAAPAVPASTTAPTPVVAVVNPASIAILPFANLSSDPDNQYFADGIQDEILTRLAKLSAIKVISRTSTLHYAGTRAKLSTIADDLGVANIVEGSVQKIGNAVRINVQLIAATSDSHLWAETYDRQLADVFGIQSEVASEIAEALQATLTPDEKRALEARPTTNAAAYDAYLHGLSFERHAHYTNDYSAQARDAFAKAVALDPDFADGWLHLEHAQGLLYFYHDEHTPQALAAMKADVDAVTRLRPDSGEAWLALGDYRFRGLGDYAGALEAFNEALARRPNDAEILGDLALLERRVGRMPRALAHIQNAESIDPRNPVWSTTLGEFLAAVRRYPEARAAYERALESTPGDSDILVAIAATHQAEGDLTAAQSILSALPPARLDDSSHDVQVTQALLLRRYEPVVQQCTNAIAEIATAAAAAAEISGHACVADAQQLLGNLPAAKAAWQRVLDLAAKEDLDTEAYAIHISAAHAGLGDKAAALKAAESYLADHKNDTKEAPDASLQLARVHASFGDADAAIQLLAPLLDQPYGPTPALLRLHPAWDPIRSDPRFQALSAQTPLHPESPARRATRVAPGHRARSTA